MTTPTCGLDTAWSEWSQALVSTLFPGGLGPGQHFAFGQTTLIADFANADPQVANAEIFRIGDAVPAAAPNFVPMASLSDAYGFFLQRIASPALATAQANMAAANSAAQSGFNMPAKVGTQAPAGCLPPGPGKPGPALQATFLPAYELDAGFRTRYEEWQASSARGDTRAGGVIGFSSRLGGPAATSPPMQALMLPSVSALAAQAPSAPAGAPQAPTPPAFFRVVTAVPAPAPLLSMPGASLAQPPGSSMGPAPGAVEHSRPVLLSADGGPSTFSLEVSFTGLGTFMIGPARWFSDTAVRLFADQLSPADKTLFFATGGVLARRIYQVVVAFEPTVILSFDDRQVFDNAKALLSDPQGDSVGIGPLNFHANVVSSTGSGGPLYSDDVQTITIGPVPSTLPILLGVVSTDVATFPPAS
ncbi:hypothetical protein [Pseudoduganella buxea]|uniref:Uncharacterized protein n=1 Tax=Pseudoduganella buxea TaxID=1949069 RepID=A0A6I3T3T0_9BURK|nr:hypothetical protein [Pseudoduganella buxea]MTV56310.1 hypothetical protein [Pseudoduganella buxea]GGC03110.1 hypothetical protein GCM10011572_26360 [Pseudoduganella buxea]